MEKNDFLKMNDLIYYLYTEKSFDVLKSTFLRRIGDFVPYSYSSILMIKEKDGILHFDSPICYPQTFLENELKNLRFEDLDHTNWPLYSKESVIIRESEVINDATRLNTPIYRNLYSKYNIYDTLQMSIVYESRIFAILTLYRDHKKGRFTHEDDFYLHAFSKHLNYIFADHLGALKSDNGCDASVLRRNYRLTPRECEITSYILAGMNNAEILSKITVSPYTLQKHIQNIYKKMNVSSRIELLKFKI